MPQKDHVEDVTAVHMSGTRYRSQQHIEYSVYIVYGV